MEQVAHPGWEKFKAFWIKANLQYLVLAFLLYGFKAGLYFLIAGIPTTRMGYFAIGDESIPLLKYFYVFYLGYYFVPEIFMWILSFYDKRKIFNLVVGGAMVNIVAYVCFAIYQIKMQRPTSIDLNMAWSEVHDLSSFFDRLLAFQYNADSTATNCYPSLHANFGGLLFMLGLPVSKEEVTKEHHFPWVWRIFCMIFGLGIVCSTFFVKQHYWIDAVLGMMLMAAMYFVAKVAIDMFLEARALPKEEKKNKTGKYLHMSGLMFNGICVAICFSMFLFGVLMATGHVTPAIDGSSATPEIISLGGKYMLGFGLALLVSGLIFAFYLCIYLAKKELPEKASKILQIVLGALSVNPFYISSGIVRLSEDK